MLWESKDLIHWSQPRLISFDGQKRGCMWAPDILPMVEGNYLLHWSSPLNEDGRGKKVIWSVTTGDFVHFSEPKVMLDWPGGTVIDSATAVEDRRVFLFVKSEDVPKQIILLESDQPDHGYTEDTVFRETLEDIKPGQYEAPMIYRLPNGKWCLMLDYYGEAGDKQGYVPLVADRLCEGRFHRADECFLFPYGFKHGTVLPITAEEYERIRNHVFSGGNTL